MAKRTPRATPEQFEVMVNFMTAHPYLVHAKLSASLPITQRDGLWEELSSTLNSRTFGPKKTTLQWRRVWTDLKSEVKDKLVEQEQRRRRGSRADILNPCHKKVAKLLVKASDQCAFLESRSLTVPTISDSEKEVGVKNEESAILQNADLENSTLQPIIVSLMSLKNQETPSESHNIVKCEESTANDSSDPEILVPYSQTGTHIEENQPVTAEVPVQSTMPVFDKLKSKPKRKRHRKAEIEDKNLSDLVEAEKEKANMLLAIANAISASDEIVKKRLKVEEDRNRLLQERNTIESERNELFKSLLEHFMSKEIF